MTINETQTKSIVFSAKTDKPLCPSLILNNSIIEDVAVHEYLGLTLSSKYLDEGIYLKFIKKKLPKN